jgi:hypothetical protein
VNDEGEKQTRSTEVLARPQGLDPVVRLTLGWNLDWEESGGMSFIMSLTEATGGASSSGREVLKPFH